MLGRLANLPYLEHCGEPCDEPWAAAKVRDMQSAIFGNGVEFGAFKALHVNELEEWVAKNQPDDFITDLRKRVTPALAEIVGERIWPKLPTNIRRADADTIRQVKALFLSDLLYIVLDSSYGPPAPAGIYSRLLDAYASGHYPCGWIGEYPEGRLVVY